jgi:D-3-phosphoglycerate dehydrogenase
MEKFKVLVTDGVSSTGVGVLSNLPEFDVIQSKSLSEDELIEKITDIDALIVRSQTKVSANAMKNAKKLKVIGRAGVGVDNVDVEAATERGIVVMNTPAGNTVSTAELTFSHLLNLARSIPQAHLSMKEGKWDRKSFQGIEISNKVLGVIGMGRIGTEVARRAFAFGMRVLAFDPFLSEARAKSLHVELFDKLDNMLPLCDFITLHIPMTKETQGLLDARRLSLCKKGARIINCARGGLVVEKDLNEAIQSGQIAAAALDVYEEEPPAKDLPLRSLQQVVMTPHLGASTAEAQESVGIEIAESIRDLLLHGAIRSAVNMPNVDAKVLQEIRPYLDFGTKLGKMIAQLSPNRCEQISVDYYGKIGEKDTTPITRAILKGFLTQAGGSAVNEVNVTKYAENLGLKYSETKQSQLEDYSELILVKAIFKDETVEVGGTFFGTQPKIVRINDHRFDARPEGVLFIFQNKDRPGVIGWMGTLMGKHNVNIASMSLSRSGTGSKALCILNLDSMPPQEVIDTIRNDKDIYSVQIIQL